MVSGRGGKRPGAGRKVGSTKADGLPTHVVRVSTEITKEQVQAVPELIAKFNHWEDELIAARERGESLRTYEKLAKLLDEVRALGF
jgi:hypothetical protein